ncbi:MULTISPECIES: M48 family metallopeptidase [Pseudoalteromonas]|uniref:M48 family metallopeptidase n=1 Tax=Pseudoalteromonas TaxID=53246 RepID=UPI001AD6207C|nr:SprT family zinc-dependent metalloprotease [Pseudoalteromonas sp. K222D]MBO7927960.1 M48 family metallopeptidase [Pseudoalteromonas sp. K222D]
MFAYQLKKSTRRKTVAIKVHNQNVTVYAPHHVQKKVLDNWLLEKKSWVEAQLQKQLTLVDTKQYPLKDKKIWVFSEAINLTFQQGNTSTVERQQDGLLITVSARVKHQQQKYQLLLEAYLKEQLTAYIEMRLNDFCTQMQEALPNDLNIAVYKRKWGSCNSKRALTFNLLLIGAPHSIIDYVIVHELAHLRYLNHSKAFWQRVAQFCPDYKASTLWLKQHGMSLQWVF